jgi:transcriptional regulator with XRE-family HTH domain
MADAWPESQNSLLGRKIRRWRKDRRLSVADLSSRVGIQRAELTRIEKGEHRIHLDLLFEILTALDAGASPKGWRQDDPTLS